MSSSADPKPARPPLIMHIPAVGGPRGSDYRRMLPAALASAVFHVGLFALLLLVVSPSNGRSITEVTDENTVTTANPVREEDLPPLLITDYDPDALDPTEPLAVQSPREGPLNIAGDLHVNEDFGTPGGRDDPLRDVPEAKGYGDRGVGQRSNGTDAHLDPAGAEDGERGDGRRRFVPGGVYGRSSVAKKKALVETGGGTDASEAAVVRGLEWLIRHQATDGHWSLDGFNQAHRCNCADRGSHNNDIAATAFGLLPLLGAGHTHKPGDKANPNPYRKHVLAGLNYLMRKQNKRTGDFGGGMYSHGLAAIAVCEAYALTQDPLLKTSAQSAVNYIVFAQHRAGGWRYGPKQLGDTSVVGWQVMALKSAQMAGLDVKAQCLKKAQDYLDGCMSDADGGYGYFGKGSTPTMSAVGLLCRQYLQGWGPSSPRMSKGVKNWLMVKHLPTGKSMYFNYYATQVLHHFGGDNWDKWNTRMRDLLIREQDQGAMPRRPDQKGSWSPVGDPHGDVGGRLMITSLSILTLEVYYRHLPLYRRITDGNLKR